MSDGDGTARRLAERTWRSCLRGMLLAVTAVSCLPLFVFALISVVTVASGLGLVVAPKVLLAVRCGGRPTWSDGGRSSGQG